MRFARMVGSSIAGRDAAAWITDFLNAAYYRRSVDDREVDDLRLAWAVLTTFWHRKERGRRLRMTDLAPFHRAFGSHRFDTELSGRGLLSREQLLEGATQLLGDWFPYAYADDARRGWGIAFGSGHNRLILYSDAGRPWVRAIGTWDPMPWHVDQAYRRAGRGAQHAFWGQGEVERLSMLHQLANYIA